MCISVCLWQCSIGYEDKINISSERTQERDREVFVFENFCAPQIAKPAFSSFTCVRRVAVVRIEVQANQINRIEKKKKSVYRPVCAPRVCFTIFFFFLLLSIRSFILFFFSICFALFPFFIIIFNSFSNILPLTAFILFRPKEKKILAFFCVIFSYSSDSFLKHIKSHLPIQSVRIYIHTFTHLHIRLCISTWISLFVCVCECVWQRESVF